jgi:hypothetical protein
MQRRRVTAVSLSGLVMIIVGAAIAALHASDPVAVYARVDRVVFAPSADAPQTIQVFGIFSLAVPANPNDYQPAARGYLYFKLAGDEGLARREWADLKDVAGTKQIVAFGSRFQLKPRLRPASEAPDAPDPYLTAMGLTRVNGRTEYAPIRALIDYRH